MTVAQCKVTASAIDPVFTLGAGRVFNGPTRALIYEALLAVLTDTGGGGGGGVQAAGSHYSGTLTPKKMELPEGATDEEMRVSKNR